MKRNHVLDVALPAATLLLLVGAWQVYVRAFDVSTIVLPAPSDVWVAMRDQWRVLLDSTWYTGVEIVIGFLLSIVVAVPIAVAINLSPILQRTIYPLLLGSQSVPKLALAPVVLLWLGYGSKSRIFIVVLTAFFPIVVDTALGLRMTPAELLEMSRSLRASRWQILRKVQSRQALPNFFAGLKVASTLAVVGAVISEFVGSEKGLGNLILTATSQSDTALAFAALVILSLLGIALFLVIVVIERYAAPWATDHTSGSGTAHPA